MNSLYIPELNRELHGRLLAIWQGTADGMSEEKRQQYIRLWKRLAAGAPPTQSVPVEKAKKATAEPCPHLGPMTSERVACRSCNKSNAKTVEVFACSKYGRCTLERGAAANGVQLCKSCDDNPKNAAVKEAKAKRREKIVAAKVAPGPWSTLVPPSQKRPGIYRGGILQIMVTRACDRSCANCTQGSNLKGPVHHMTPEQFLAAVESVKDYFGVIGVFGGNPTLSPHFAEYCTILRGAIPWERRGLWSNHPKGMGRHAAITFNPAFSNLNVHQSQEAYDEFAKDWPECRPFLKGLESDSRHSPPFVAMKDIIPDEAERWKLIQDCDINRNWSALIGIFRGQLRGWFCEIAGAQAMLHQDDFDKCPSCGDSDHKGKKMMQYGPMASQPVLPCWDCAPDNGVERGPTPGTLYSYPDTGVPITPGWWNQGMEAFADQAKIHCHACGIPLRGHGALANGDSPSQFSATHAGIYRTRGGAVEQVTELIQLGSPLKRVTDYIQNGAAG